MKKHTCPGCGGKRTYTHMIPEVRYSITHPNGWTGTPVKVAYETGRMVARDFPCAVCHGSGRVDCQRCADTGYWEEFDYATGEFAGLYPCDCAAGRREMAAETVTTRAAKV